MKALPLVNDDDGQEYHHKCPSCGQLFGCDWRAVGMLEEQARRLKIIAGMWRARLLGAQIGRPKLHVFDESVARELTFQGLSLRAIAKALGDGVHPEAVRRAIQKGRDVASHGKGQ